MKRFAGSFLFVFASAVTLTSSAAGAPNPSPQAAIATEEFMVPSLDPGIELYVRNRHPAGVTRFGADRILLFVHGATYPAEATFDLALGGLSMMQFIAQNGYDVYLVDVRGYGRSTRPAAMDQPPGQNPPIARTETAVNDVGAAVDFILRRRGVPRISLMGWSWGTAIMGAYAARTNEKVVRLVQYAPRWLSSAPSLADTAGPLGAYRTVTMAAVKDRWLKGVPDDKKADLIPPGWFDTFAKALLASDPASSRSDAPVLRAPNGVLQDNREYWTAGKPLYDPASIRVPVLVVHGDWDQDLPSSQTSAYFAKLTGAPYRRWVEIGEGTHTVFLEKNRMQLFREVQAFLDESFTPGE